jgi:rhodanese-related sulfurtransferase
MRISKALKNIATASDKIVKAQLKAVNVRLFDFRTVEQAALCPVLGSDIIPSTWSPDAPNDAAIKAEGAVDSGKIPSQRDTPMVLFCSGGVRAGIAAERLHGMGYTNVINGGTGENVNEHTETV